MDTLEKMRGQLELVIGSGWISAWELGRLAPGDVVNTRNLAGTHFSLCWQGQEIAAVTTAVVGGADRARRDTTAWLCPRIVSLERRDLAAPEPNRGREILELLPFSISLGGAESGLEDLEGLGRGSVINLGIRVTDPQEAWLVVFGKRVARGQVMVQESMAIQILEVLIELPEPGPFRSSTSVVRAREDDTWPVGASSLKIYDFRKPDCYSRDQILALANLHHAFAQAFATLCGKDAPGLELYCVDQLNFTEFVGSLPEGEKMCIGLCPSPGRPAMAEDERPLRAVRDLEVSPDFPVEALDQQLKVSWERLRTQAVMVAGPMLDGWRDQIFMALRDSWKTIGGLNPWPHKDLVRPPASSQSGRPALEFAPWAEEFEMVGLVSFKVADGSWLNIAYINSALTGVLGNLVR